MFLARRCWRESVPRSILRSNATGAQSHDPKRNCSGRRALAGIRREAEKIVAIDPVFGASLAAAILDHPDLAGAVSHQIGERLGKAPPTASDLARIAREAFAGSPDLVEAATRDLQGIAVHDPATSGFLPPLLNFKGYVALQAWRVSNWLWREGRTDLALLLQSLSSDQLQVSIHPSASIGTSVFLDHATGIIIGAFAVIGDEVTILQHVTIGRNPSMSGPGSEDRPRRSAQLGGNGYRRCPHRRLRQNRRGRGGRARCARRVHRGRRSRPVDQLPGARGFRLTATPRTARNGLRPQSYPSCQLPLARTESLS